MRMSVRAPRARLWAVVSALGCALLAGCSSLGLSTDRIDYGRVQPQRALDVPPDLTPLPGNDRFQVPGVATASGAQTAGRPAQPGTATVAPGAPNARIERAGNQRWLAVDVPPEQAFATVREFFPSLGLTVEREDASLGLIETGWSENRAKLPQDVIRRTIGRVFDGLYSTGEQDKYRARVERTVKNTAEIFVSHRGMIEVYANPARDSTRWQPRPADPELEAEMLQRLLLRFAPAATAVAATVGSPGTPVTSGSAPAAAAGGAALAPGNARIVKAADGKSSRLDIDEPFDRAWRRVGLGLDRGGFTVEDRDRTKGTYFVRFLDPEFEAKQREQQGIFSKLFGGDLKIDAPRFRVVLETAGAGTRVQVQSIDGKPEQSATGEKILTLLRDQLR